MRTTIYLKQALISSFKLLKFKLARSVFIGIVLLSYDVSNSQDTGICGTPIDTLPVGSALNSCFDLEDVWDNGLPVYVKVNVHFILNDDCTGSIDPLTASDPVNHPAIDQSHAYSKAEEMINSTNYMMEQMETRSQWNQAEWGKDVTAARPTHFRFILKGVYLHCNTAAKASNYNHSTNLGVNIAEEINIFMVDLPGEIIGITHGSFALKSQVFHNWCIGHEIGHLFGLNHTFDYVPPANQCPDTWSQRWEWDDDCNINTNDVLGNRCWHSDVYQEKNIPENQTKVNIDVNSDGLYSIPPDFIERLCEPEWQGSPIANPCYRHPCCAWFRQNNNLMDYSAWARNDVYNALTPCQIDIMLNRANNSHCAFVEQVDGIAPPSAFISILPSDELRDVYCSYCLRLEASVNDEYYKLDIYDNTNNSLLTSTDWLEGPADLYCIKTLKEKSSHAAWFGGFLPTHDYTAVLTVKNSADVEDTYELEFTTPETGCYDVAENNFIVSPSPATTTNINFHYNLPNAANVDIFAAHAFYGMYSGVLRSVDSQSSGPYDLTINTSSWYSGINFIIIQIDDEVYSTAIVKP